MHPRIQITNACPAIGIQFLFFLGVECPSSHPFAYLNGWYCCQTKEERPTWYNSPKTPQNEIDSGTCDGLDFNRKSRCCKDERNTPCSDTNKCFDYVGGTGKYCISRSIRNLDQYNTLLDNISQLKLQKNYPRKFLGT